MHLKQWQKALPYAEQAGESFSSWGLEVLAGCHEALGHWAEAEAIYKAEGERYPDTLGEWYAFCRRTGRGDLASARRTFAEAADSAALSHSPRSLAYYLLEKEPDRAKQLFEELAKYGSPLHNLHLALLADRAHDASARDKILNKIKQIGATCKQKPPMRRDYTNLFTLAGLIAADLAQGGKGEIDMAAAGRLNPPTPFDADQGCCRGDEPAIAFPYLLGRYLDQHGKAGRAVECWKECLAQTDLINDPHRTLAAAELQTRGERLASEESKAHGRQAATGSEKSGQGTVPKR